MDKKFFGFFIIIFGFLLLLAIGYFLFFNIKELPKKEEPITNVVEGDDGTQVKRVIFSNNINQKENEEKPPVVKRDLGKEELQFMAASFAERFGTYSNQSNFGNITDLKIFMTDRMRAWADSYVTEQRKSGIDRSIYYGITTKAIFEDAFEYDEDLGTASVLVKTRRQESTISTTNVSDAFNQDIIIIFSKQREAWRVDSANWQEK